MKNLQEMSLDEMKKTEGSGIVEGIQSLTQSVSTGVKVVTDFGSGFIAGFSWVSK